ncbi:proline-rich receptor-like protein kinase PERK9 [Penaeus chinensis]|uniref:proline-rich receptor-like protein kinase PERK9 n=1 Tax=Penaeus chinensis TaxID=139456 RepID=UPI001FB62901|nr:proline-rich receptor-like protein kinase PERK9 [Penaeus chinensis]
MPRWPAAAADFVGRLPGAPLLSRGAACRVRYRVPPFRLPPSSDIALRSPPPRPSCRRGLPPRPRRQPPPPPVGSASPCTPASCRAAAAPCRLPAPLLPPRPLRPRPSRSPSARTPLASCSRPSSSPRPALPIPMLPHLRPVSLSRLFRRVRRVLYVARRPSRFFRVLGRLRPPPPPLRPVMSALLYVLYRVRRRAASAYDVAPALLVGACSA